jgi:hypothetical protein
MVGEAGFTGDKATICAVLVAGALLASALNACGGSGASGANSSDESKSGSPPAAGFSKEAELAAFGEESSEAELREASLTLEINQSSRDRGLFGRQCQTLAAPVLEEIEERGGGKSCGEVLREEAATEPRVLVENSFVGPGEAFRVEGNVGYVLYHGKREKEYAMEMERENGEWKVVSVRNEVIH